MKEASMVTFRTRLPVIAAAAFLLFVGGQPQVLARGSHAGHDGPWNSEHIGHLPPEVRDAVVHVCGNSPRAAHYFATYLDNSHIIKLHFEHLRCSDGGPLCNGDGCLHQEYVSTGGKYRLIRSYYGRNDD